MGAQLKIDGDETYALAAELASLRGESIEAVVNRALREALERDKVRDEEAHKGSVEEKVGRLKAILDNIHRELPNPLPYQNHDWLYDELGLPK